MKKEKKLKGKCTNCGKPMEQVSNQNWNVYCNKDQCQKAFMKIVLDMKINGVKSPYQ